MPCGADQADGPVQGAPSRSRGSSGSARVEARRRAGPPSRAGRDRRPSDLDAHVVDPRRGPRGDDRGGARRRSARGAGCRRRRSRSPSGGGLGAAGRAGRRPARPSAGAGERQRASERSGGIRLRKLGRPQTERGRLPRRPLMSSWIGSPAADLNRWSAGRGVPLGDLVPVDDVPPRLEVVRALVLVLEVVGVLPDVVAQQRRLSRRGPGCPGWGSW